MALLSGKSIAITGAGRGLGRAFAIRAAALDANIVVNDLNEVHAQDTVRAIQALGKRAIAVPGSVADWDVSAALTETCVRTYGAIDGLVNNAGIHFAAYPGQENAEQIRRLIQVNVIGTIYCGVHALKAMTAQCRGSIVNVTSGAHIGMDHRATYGASKGAVASLTYGWARDAMPYGVKVNALSPTANTPASQEFQNDPTFGNLDAPPDTLPPPEAIAPAVTFLLSDLSNGVTGQIVRMTGTMLSLVAHPTVGAPFAERARWADWNEEEIAAEFRDTFRAELKPVGLGAAQYQWTPAS